MERSIASETGRTVRVRVNEKSAQPHPNYRMRMGNDWKFHFEDADMRRKAGDDYVFDGTEPGALDFIGNNPV